jgi:hypothetical protein
LEGKVENLLEQIEGWNGWTKGCQLTVFQPDMMEVYEVSMTETEDMDFLQHLLSAISDFQAYSIQVFVVVTDSNLRLASFLQPILYPFNCIISKGNMIEDMSNFEHHTPRPSP